MKKPKRNEPVGFLSSNHHRVHVFGWLLYHVTSASRRGLVHIVDLEGYEHWKTVCTCEAWRYGSRPCRHIAACLEFIAEGFNVAEDHREEWIERLIFLLSMNHEFIEAIESDALKAFRDLPPKDPPKPVRKPRIYKLDQSKTYEAPTAKDKEAGR
jgi:hypothetical protein